MKKTNKLAICLSVAFALLLLWGQVYAVLYTASARWPETPEGTTARFWRSGTGTVTLTNKDSVGRTGTLLSLPFSIEENNGVGGTSVPTELYFGGLYCGGADSLCDSLIVTYWWYDASGDSGRLAPTDTFKVDTVGMGGLTTGKIGFVFRTSILEPEGNAYIPSRIAVKVGFSAGSDDSAFFDDCFLLGRWGQQ